MTNIFLFNLYIYISQEIIWNRKMFMENENWIFLFEFLWQKMFCSLSTCHTFTEAVISRSFFILTTAYYQFWGNFLWFIRTRKLHTTFLLWKELFFDCYHFIVVWTNFPASVYFKFFKKYLKVSWGITLNLILIQRQIFIPLLTNCL